MWWELRHNSTNLNHCGDADHDSRVHDDHRCPHHNYGTAANDLRCVYDNHDREQQLDLRTACPSCGQ